MICDACYTDRVDAACCGTAYCDDCYEWHRNESGFCDDVEEP